MKSLLKGILLALFFSQFCIAQWYWQNPVPPLAYELFDVKFFDNNRGIIIGAEGINYLTTNGGNTWGGMIPGIENNLIDMHFLNDSFGLLISQREYGYLHPPIFKTTDAGNSWIELSNHPGYYSYFKSVFIVDSLSYYIAGWEPSNYAYKGCVFYTFDGGNTWGRISQFGDFNELRDIEFINDSIGITVTSDGKIYRTTDKGLNWTLMYTFGNGLRSISFCDSNNGFAIGGLGTNQQGLATTDGGLSWHSAAAPNEIIDKLQFYSFTCLVAVGTNYSIYRSTDQGNTWDQLLRLGSGFSNGFHGVSLFDINNIIAVGTAGRIYHSSDSGITWHSKTQGSTGDLFALFMVNRDYGMVVGRNGIIQKTVNGGATWQVISSGYTVDFNGVYGIDTLNYVVVGETGTIIKTTDGGASWNQINSSTNSELTDVEFYNNNFGFAVGHSGIILKTLNGGESWIQQPINTSMDLESVCFLDSSRIFITERFYNILRSTNSGSDWEVVYSGNSEWFHSLSTMGTSGIIATGGSNDHTVILKSTDLGQNWIQLNSPSPNLQSNCNGSSFIDLDNGLICFEGGQIFRTSDGGNSWNFQGNFFQCVTQSLVDIQMLNYYDATAVGWCGTIASTITDHIIPVELISFTAIDRAGKVLLNWTTASELNNHRFEIEREINYNNKRGEWTLIGYRSGKGTTAEKNEYSFIDDITGFNSELLRYRLKQIDFNGSYSFSKIIEVHAAPSSFSITQNFPNPFNPVTTIQYSIPQKSNVTLKVYDILGNEIATLVNEEKAQGVYTINFSTIGGSASGGNASQLASGIYLYRIQAVPIGRQAGSFVNTKKMILLK